MSWAIIDDNGIIHLGDEEEMTMAFEIIVEGRTYRNFSDDEIKQYNINFWKGDLRLVQIHKIET